MTLVKRNSSQFPKFFDDFFGKDLFDWGYSNFSIEGSSLPKVNIIENDDAFMVETAIPGMNKKDFTIELDNDILKISAKKEMNDDNGKNYRYVRREFNYQTFQRTFHLPKKVVDESKIEAQYKDGILSVLIPKREEAKALPPRNIKIQ